MIIVGLTSSTGPGSGKSYVAERLVNEYVGWTRRLSFATPVKAIGNTIVDQLMKHSGEYDLRVGKDETIPGTEVTPRDIFVAVGEGGRHYNPRLWVELLLDRLDVTAPREDFDDGVPELVIIDDVRKQEEVEALRGLEGGPGVEKVFIVNIVDGDSPVPRKDSTDLVFNQMDFDMQLINRRGEATGIPCHEAILALVDVLGKGEK